MVAINMSLELESFGEFPSRPNFIEIFDKVQATGWSENIVKPVEPLHNESHSSFEEGYQIGLEQGRLETAESAAIEARKQFDQDLQVVRQCILQFEQALIEIEENALQDCLQLAIEIARKMTLSNVALNTDAVFPIIKHAVSLLPAITQTHEIHVHPLDALRIHGHLKTALTKKHFAIIPDEAIEAGGCTVVSPTNRIEATNQHRWSQICALLDADCEWVKG